MNPEELLDDIHKSIEEERVENPKIANFLDKNIRAYNRHWLIENQNTLIMRENGQEERIIQVLIATRLGQLRHFINLDNRETFTEICGKINNKMNNLFISQAASDPIQDELIELKDGTKVDFYENFEYIIAKYDKEYPERLEEKLMEIYETALKHKDSRLMNAGELTDRDKEKIEELHDKNTQLKKLRFDKFLEENGIKKEENPAPVSEPEEAEETQEPQEEINSIEEWALELGNYIVNERNKLVRR